MIMAVLKVSDMKTCMSASKHRVKRKTHRVFNEVEGESTKTTSKWKAPQREEDGWWIEDLNLEKICSSNRRPDLKSHLLTKASSYGSSSSSRRSPWLPPIAIGATSARAKGVSSRHHKRRPQ
jgi:hypothetical protein